MRKRPQHNRSTALLIMLLTGIIFSCKKTSEALPNIIVIYVDDLGYGDLSAYGTEHISTPNVDRLAQEGRLFTNAYATSAICTPSRYSFLTGEYHWRKEENWSVGNIKGVGIAPGDAGLVIDTAKTTVADVLQQAGYHTGVVGKWHLGLGPIGGPDWNGYIFPGPQDIGFDHFFLMPATADRVPCVFVENGRVVGLDVSDPIHVSYTDPIGDDSTIYNPDAVMGKIISYDADSKRKDRNVVMHPSFGHDQTIINGIPRIGYMTGGHAALWKDDEIAETLTGKAVDFIERNQKDPFFLYFATHDIHVPRVPGKSFSGKSPIGVYGDVLLQMDWSVGQLLKKLDELGLTENTLIVLTSDNGSVQDDGYHDGTVENMGRHVPSGSLREGKYSAYEGGTKVPFIVRWPNKIKPGRSEAMFSQVDLLATLAALTGHHQANSLSTDSRDYSQVLMGEGDSGRDHVVQQNMSGTLSVVKDGWKYIEPTDKPTFNFYTRPKSDMGNRKTEQLYHLVNDPGELKNLADAYPDKLRELVGILSKVRKQSAESQ